MTEKKDSDILPIIVGTIALAAGVTVGYFVLPEVVKLLSPQKKETVTMKKPNPNPEPNPTPEPAQLRPKFTRRLQGRYAHSGTSYDSQSLAQNARDREVTRLADAVRQSEQRNWTQPEIKLSPDNKARFREPPRKSRVWKIK